MNDRAFLMWLHDKLIDKGEDDEADFMSRLRTIARAQPVERYTLPTETEHSEEFHGLHPIQETAELWAKRNKRHE